MYNKPMKSKKSPTSLKTSQLIASHALVAAFFTAPWVVLAINDVFNIALSREAAIAPAGFVDTLQANLSIVSSVFLLVAVVSAVYYVIKKSK